MIETITTSLALYHAHHASELHCIVIRNREKRKAFWLSFGITFCTVLIYLVLIYG